MSTLLTQYNRGFHQEVYDEILAMKSSIFHHSVSSDVYAVADAMMKRVHNNVKVILTHLQTMGYLFGAGFFEENMSQHERAEIERDAPIYQTPSRATSKDITVLEKMYGSLPLCLKAWYEVVGSVNFIGLFPSYGGQLFERNYGVILDPLFVYSVQMVLKMSAIPFPKNTNDRTYLVPISPDSNFKYGFSGSGNYAVEIPSPSFDAPLLLENHKTTFMNYLRLSIKWGGFPGLEQDCRLSKRILDYLIDGIVPF